MPILMPFTNLRTPASDWVTIANELRPGLLAARTAISDDDCLAAIQLINLSGRSQYLRRHAFMGQTTLGTGQGRQCIAYDAATDSTISHIVGSTLQPLADADQAAERDNPTGTGRIMPPEQYKTNWYWLDHGYEPVVWSGDSKHTEPNDD
jgi:hypothetical protein